MSVSDTYNKLKEMIPYMRVKTGVQFDEDAIKHTPFDLYKMVNLINKPRALQERAFDVMMDNIGFDKDEPPLTSAGTVGNEDMSEAEVDIHKMCRAARRLDALVRLENSKGYFKARPAMDTIGQKLLESVMEIFSKYMDPMMIVKIRNELSSRGPNEKSGKSSR